MPEVSSDPGETVEPELCVLARSNNSLDARQRWSIFGALAALSLVLATVFAWVGAWPVLIYSALEITLLAVAFRLVERRALDWERLTVAGDRIVLERHARGRDERREYNRYWVRVEIVDDAGKDYFGRGARIVLRAAGERTSFGDALAAPQRLAVAAKLRRLTLAN